jgi:hypothetical protein
MSEPHIDPSWMLQVAGALGRIEEHGENTYAMLQAHIAKEEEQWDTLEHAVRSLELDAKLAKYEGSKAGRRWGAAVGGGIIGFAEIVRAAAAWLG